MLSLLLMSLKILGIILLILLGIILLLILLVLFVPVRYRLKAHREKNNDVPVVADIKVTWLLHILNAAFIYPKAPFLRVRIFCFTVFRSDCPPTRSRPSPAPEEASYEHLPEEKEKEKSPGKAMDAEEPFHDREKEQETPEKKEPVRKRNKLFEFLGKLWTALKNIKYTITRIYGKIKHIVKNIQYYLKVIKSDTFGRAWDTCKGQALYLLKSVCPRRITGSIRIGTGDPASTGQVLAVYGILYPLLGNHIDIVPEFEEQVIEGELFVKGKITVFKVLKTAWIVYFNKDLRRLIKLFKREAA